MVKHKSQANFEEIHTPVNIFEPLSSMVESTNRALNDTLQNMSPLPNLIDSINASLSNVGLQLSKNIEIFQQFQQTVTEQLKQTVEQFNHLQRYFVENAKDAEQVGPLFEEALLWIPLSVTGQFWQDIRAIYQSGQLTTEVLKKTYLETFRDNRCDNLDYIISGWWDNQDFLVWERHILDAFDAHKDAKYTLSIPTLLIVINGIMSRLHQNPPNQLSALVSRTKDKLGKKLSDSYLSLVHGKPFISTLNQLYTYGEIVTRHDTLHGRNPDYDTELYSLRLFLLLDMFHSLLSQVKI